MISSRLLYQQVRLVLWKNMYHFKVVRIHSTHRDRSGILIFVSGQEEVHRLCESLKETIYALKDSKFETIDIFPLYSGI